MLKLQAHGTSHIDVTTPTGLQYVIECFSDGLFYVSVRFGNLDIFTDGRRQSGWPVVLPHEGMLPGEWLSFHLGFEVSFIDGRELWACGRRVRRWATQGAQRRVVHGRARCAEGASSTCP